MRPQVQPVRMHVTFHVHRDVTRNMENMNFRVRFHVRVDVCKDVTMKMQNMNVKSALQVCSPRHATKSYREKYGGFVSLPANMATRRMGTGASLLWREQGLPAHSVDLPNPSMTVAMQRI